LLDINRNRLTTRQTRTTEEDRKIMTIVDGLYMEFPFYGQRKRVRQLMRIMGIEALVPKPSTSVPAKGHEIFPYLLRKRVIGIVDDV
jgi:putative transposase